MSKELDSFPASTHYLEDYSVEELLKAAKYNMLYGDIKRTRESSLVLTKIDEALLWLSQCDYLAEED